MTKAARKIRSAPSRQPFSAAFPIEIDVQMSADGRAVVFHDWNLLRLTGFDARVEIRPFRGDRKPAARRRQRASSRCSKTFSISSKDGRP